MPQASRRTEFISCSAVAHSSTANLGPGFDVFGLGLDAFEDTVTITRGKKIEDSVPHVNLTLSGDDIETISPNASENTAGLVVRRMSYDLNLNGKTNWALDLHISKKIPTGYGMGSSAASAGRRQHLHSMAYSIYNCPRIGLLSMELRER